MKRCTGYLSLALVAMVLLLAGCGDRPPSADRQAPPPPPVEAAQSDDAAGRIEALLARLHGRGQFVGVALVADGGRVVYANGFGHADANSRLPNTPETKFRIGSLTKAFTAALVLQLVERGRLRLDDTLSAALPAYTGEGAAAITLHHLLSHTSGLADYTAQRWFPPDSERPIGVDELVARIAALPPTFAPGEGFAYSNSNYVLLGAVIERVAGTPYATALRDGILAPLGMGDTGYDGNEPGEGHAAGYATAAQVIPARHLDMSWPYAAGAMYSTARDLLRWAEALETDAILSAASRAHLVRPNLGSYAYGWEIDRRQVNGNRVALHGERSAGTAP